jgi:60 kDa SS-A/Ro ribonucleoprotein
MRINLKRAFPMGRTHEGAVARTISDVERLRRLVLPCLLWEDAFYVDGRTIAEQMREAVAAVPAGVAAATAIEARERFHLRHAPLWVVREMARRHAGSAIVGDTLARVIGRPDEIGEFVALYWKDKREPLSAQAKKGLAKAFGKFDRYQLAKYAKGGAVRLRDVMFLTHPKPGADAAGVWKEIADDAISAKDAGTWEARLSAGEDKKEAFGDLLRSGKLGYLALLRNLRNMIESGVDERLLRDAIVARKGARRVLPFRYVAAARAVPQLESAIDKALCAAIGEMPSLPGRTFVLVDVSGSMEGRMSRKSDLTRMDAAATLAAIIPGDVRMFSFSNEVVEVPARRGMAGVDAIVRSQQHGGTYLGAAVKKLNRRPHDRLIVITDEQSHDQVPDPVAPHAYMLNVAAYRNGVGYGRWTHIDGFSEAVLRFIAEHEREAAASWSTSS